MLHDFKLALRTLSKRPLFAASVIAVMALCIGACTAVFSIFDAVLLAPLPYANAERIVLVWHTVAKDGAGVMGMSAGNYVTYRDRTRSFESVAAVTTRGYNLGTGSEPIRVTCARVSSSLLPMLAIAPAQGRWFTVDDDNDGAPKTIIISHDLWITQFGGNPGLLGTNIYLDKNPYTLVGIMAKPFQFPPEGVRGLEKAACLVPASFTPLELAMPAFNIVTFAKLNPGSGITQANSEANVVAKSILESYPAAVQKELDLRARVVTLHDQTTSSSKAAVLVFSAAVMFLLLIGCANVANLMLVRLQDREREIAIRMALGSTRFALAKQTISECLFLCLCGGAAGIVVAWQLLHGVLALNPGNISRLQDAHLDLRELTFALICALAAGLLVGVLPALRLRTKSLSQALIAAGSRGTSRGVSGIRVRNGLMALETAITLVLLIGSVLLLRSFLRLSSVPPGFNPDRVLTFSVALPEAAYQRPADVERFTDRVLERLRSLPSVTLDAAGSYLPIGQVDHTAITRPDAPAAAAGFKVAAVQTVTPNYAAALGLTPKRGRFLQPSDSRTARPVVVISETMAKLYWPDKDPIGCHFAWIAASGPLNVTVVGVLSDVRQAGLDKDPEPVFYMPMAQAPLPIRNLAFVIKTAATPEAIAQPVRRVLAEADPALPLFAMQPMTELLTHSVARQRFSAFLIALLAGSAIVLAALGIYGVLAYLVNSSAKEIGIRIALGSSTGKIIVMILRQGLSWVGAGLVAGLIAAFALTRFMATLLFGIEGNDLSTFLGMSALLLLMSAAAMVIPARRATRVDPMLSLRQE